ncbi:MAG: hypothetical protein ACI399_01725 [Candidatus Cryptobacteroides sp.]
MGALQDNPLFAALAVVFTLLFITGMRSFHNICPYLVRSVFRWKYATELEDSLQLSRSRNHIALILAVPCCMLAYSYSLYELDIFSDLSPSMKLLATCGILLMQVPIRAFLNWQFKVTGSGSKAFLTARGLFYNYTILLFLLLFTAGAASMALTRDPLFTKRLLLWLTGITYCLYVIRKGQIFLSACNPFVSFLYLCGLELLPSAILVIPGLLL